MVEIDPPFAPPLLCSPPVDSPIHFASDTVVFFFAKLGVTECLGRRVFHVPTCLAVYDYRPGASTRVLQYPASGERSLLVSRFSLLHVFFSFYGRRRAGMTTKQDRSYLHALTCDLVYKAYIDRNSSKATKLKKQKLYICFRKEFDIDHLRKFSVTFSLCRLYSPTCGSVLFHCSPFLGAPFCFTFFSPFFSLPFPI